MSTDLYELSKLSLGEASVPVFARDEAGSLDGSRTQFGWLSVLAPCIRKCWQSVGAGRTSTDKVHASECSLQSGEAAMAVPKAAEPDFQPALDLEVVCPEEAPPAIVRAPSSCRRHSQVSANERTDLSCPISQELMADPVIAADGHLYDRENIEAHIQVSGCCVCAASRLAVEYAHPAAVGWGRCRSLIVAYPPSQCSRPNVKKS
jgi:hypothetical protein